MRKAIILDSHDNAAGQALVDLWRKQVAANPLLAENHLGFAGALQLTGDFNGAESEYNKLEQLDRSNPGLAAGRASLQRAIQHQNAEKAKMAATALYNQGLYREALAEINQAVLTEPKNDNYQYLLGECLEAVGDFKGAHQAYLTCVLINPEHNTMAASRIKMMQSGQAVPAAQQALARPQPQQQQRSPQPQQFGQQQQLGQQQQFSQPQQSTQPMQQQQSPGFSAPPSSVQMMQPISTRQIQALSSPGARISSKADAQVTTLHSITPRVSGLTMKTIKWLSSTTNATGSIGTNSRLVVKEDAPHHRR